MMYLEGGCISAGYTLYTQSYKNRTQGTAISMLGEAVAGIAFIWPTSDKQFWFKEEYQISDDSMSQISRTLTYSNSSRTALYKDSGWSMPWRIH